jgi:Helix-turn-helix domain
MIEVQDRNVVEMSQRERDILKVMQPVLEGQRTQAEAARLLKLSVRQIRRIQCKLQAHGDTAIVHGLRGQPSNHQHDPQFQAKVLRAYQKRYRDFGPTFACEKLAEEGLHIGVETLRRWLLDAGLWQRRRRRDPHRSRRPRRSCFGELIQMDASIHDWLEGRGQEIVLITMIDDATGGILARFYPAGTVETHMDLLGRWLRQYGRPLALYTDRHSIFEPHEKGQPLADPDAKTQFGRALGELDIELIRAHSPQAKGRVERSFGTAQDRWVKELRLAGAKTCEEANAVLEKLLPDHNRRFAKSARQPNDAHRRLGPSYRLESILSIQHQRVVSNDYVVRWANRFYQLLPPVHPGERGGRVVIEERLDESVVIRFGNHYLKYEELMECGSSGGSAPVPPEFNACSAGARAKRQRGNSCESPRRIGTQPAGKRSGRTPAEPYPLANAAGNSSKPPGRPAQNHPWRKSFKQLK